MDDDADPLALGPRDTVPTSDDDERELERAAEWGGLYWAEAVRRRRNAEGSVPSVGHVPGASPQAPLSTTLSSPLTPVRRERTRSPPTVTPTRRLAPRPHSAHTSIPVEAVDQRPPSPSSPSPLPQPQQQEQQSDLELTAALLAFQNARTFRPRTALQLQPYTRERLAYQAVVRRGGGRGLVQALDVVPGSGDAEEEDGVYQLDASEQMEESMIDVAPSPIRTPATQDFTSYAERYPEDSTPSPTNRDLQVLVKRRIRQEKQEERKRKRLAREQRKFAEELEREMAERAQVESAKQKEQRKKKREAQQGRHPSSGHSPRNPARKTYAKRPRIHGPPPADASSARQRSKGPRDVSDLLRGLPREDSSSPSSSPEPPERHTVRQVPVVELDTTTAMEIDDLLTMEDPSTFGVQSSRLTTIISSSSEPEKSSSDSSNDDGESTPAPGPLPRSKARALNRMLPAFMIKRLDRQQQAPPAAGNARLRGDEENRPGQVRVRNRGIVAGRTVAPHDEPRIGRLDHENMVTGENDDLGIFADFGSPPPPPPLSSPPLPAFRFSAPPSPDTTNSDRVANYDRTYSVSSNSSDDGMDDEDDDDDDDDGAESVRLLHAGQFARLLNGERETPKAHRNIVPPRIRGDGLLTAARSARGVVRRRDGGKQQQGSKQKPPRSRGALRQHQHQQSRLQFPQTTANRSAAHTKSKNAPQARQSRRPTKRAARLLDDRTIFEVSEDEPEPAVLDDIQVIEMRQPSPSRPVPRVAQPQAPRHRVSAQPPAPPRVHVPPRPTGFRRDHMPPPQSPAKHKASLWSDLQDFQVDFDVKPLPSGVSFDPSTWVGRGGLAQFIQDLTIAPDPTSDTSALSVTAFGMSLTLDMPYAELSQLLPTILNGVYDQMLSLCNGRASTDQHCKASFDFLDRYMLGHVMDTSTADAVRLVEDFAERFSGLRSSRKPCPDEPQHLFLLDLSVAILKLLLRIFFRWPDAVSSPSLETSILRLTEDVIERLLAFGFDRTMKPVKAIMAFAADRPVLEGFTAECWITIIHLLRVWDHCPARVHSTPLPGSSFGRAIDNVVQRLYVDGQAGPRASERIWYITFGLAAMHQFGSDGVSMPELQAYPLWSLPRKALGLIKFPLYPEAEELEKRHLLKSRDKYIKIMVIRCLHLACTWLWKCDSDSFTIASRELGNIFKDRQLRNLPNESSSDFPTFIREYDLERSSEVDIEESTYNLFLQLVCVSASDLIGGACNQKQADDSLTDVQRLMLRIFPFSRVLADSNGIFSGRQLGALVNRYSTLIVVVLFVPERLSYVLNNAQNWVSFDCGDIEVQRIYLRGLIYAGVAARHHGISVKPVVERLADIFETVHAKKRTLSAHQGDKIKEQERLLILLVSCYRQIIERHSFEKESIEPHSVDKEVAALNKDLRRKRMYPDPCLLHKCWTSRLSSTDLITDRRAGIEVIETIQAFLDKRNAALPQHILSTRQQKLRDEESQQSEFDSLTIEFTVEDLTMLGGDTGNLPSAVVQNEKALAEIIATHISPGIYELLSNSFSSNENTEADTIDIADRQTWISRLSKCWADCASVLVVDHHLRDWAYFMGYGKESYERLADEAAKRQVGMSFCLNLLEMDPGAFMTYCENFGLLFAQGLVTRHVTIEHEYASAVLRIPASREWYLLSNLPKKNWSIEEFMAERRDMIGIMSVNISHAMRSTRTSASDKSYIYRLVNVLLGTMQHNYQSLPSDRLESRRQYSAFCDEVVNTIKRHNTDTINNNTVIKLKNFPLYII